MILQEPLRKIQTFSGRIFVEEYDIVICHGEYYVRGASSALYANTYQ
jgi:hypothetical protein